MRGAFFFTQEAIVKFRQKFAGGLAYSHAMRELKHISLEARPLREHTRDGEEQWAASDASGIIFVVRHDPKYGKICVTLHWRNQEPLPA